MGSFVSPQFLGHCDPAWVSCLPILSSTGQTVLPEPLNRRDPHRPPSDSCSPAEIKSQQLQLMGAAIWASKEITPAMPSFWLPWVHPPQLAPCTRVLPLAGQPEFLVMPFWCESQLRVALQKHLGLHPQGRLVQRGICRPSLCVHVRGRRWWEHALKASNLFIFTLLRGDRSPVTGQCAGGSSAGSTEINPWGTACFGQVASP